MLAKKIIIFKKYSDFINIFFKKSAILVLLEYFSINGYIINLKLDKHVFNRLIYSLKPIELKTFKTYIKFNIGNNFIQLSKSPVKVHIFFIKKPNKSFYLYINY